MKSFEIIHSLNLRNDSCSQFKDFWGNSYHFKNHRMHSFSGISTLNSGEFRSLQGSELCQTVEKFSELRRDLPQPGIFRIPV